MFLLLNLIPTNTFSQHNKIKLANDYFNKGEFKKALNMYQTVYKNNKFWLNKNKVNYNYLLFQISESKWHLNDSTCYNGYQKIVNNYNKINRSKNPKLDYKVILYVAESENKLKKFQSAEFYYQIASNEMDSISDYFKFGYAYCSLKQNRFGQALMLLNEIKNKSNFEPKFSQYADDCNQQLSKSISKQLSYNDTLNVTMNYKGCFGGTRYKLAFVKQKLDYKVITFKSKKYNDFSFWEVDTAYVISDSMYLKVVNFEHELKNYNQYTNTISCTLSAGFIMESKNDVFEMEITDCALGIGSEIDKLRLKKFK